MKKKLLVGCTIVFFLANAGCTLYQKPAISPLKIPANFKVDVFTNAQLKERWWENFHDQQLNRLIGIALKNNLNYQVAIKNVQITQEYVNQAASALLPQINANYGLSRNKLSNNAFNFIETPVDSNSAIARQITAPFYFEQLFLSAIYELDIWNQVGNTVNQAKANVVVSEAQGNVVKLTLVSGLANSYFQVSVLNSTLANLREQYRCLKEIVHLTLTQYQGGLIDVSLVDDAKNQMEAIKININNLEKQREILINSMAYLLGVYPEDFHYSINNGLKNIYIARLVPSGLPCKMLANRPDIQSAFYQVVSYGYLEKQNIANFLPTFNLTGNSGFSTTALGDFLNKGSLFWNYGVNVLQPIFDYGLRMSQYRASKLQFEAAMLTYKSTVINAFSEVDSALASYKKDYNAFHAYQDQLINTKEKLDVASAQFRAGLTDYSSYLTIKLSYLQTSYNLTNQKLLVIQDVIQVYKTMGLGIVNRC